MNTLKTTLLLLLTLIIVTPAIRPLFHSEFFHLHDYTHVARLVEMDKAIKDGHFPVRWSRNFGFGYGMPLFNFYGPTPFYIAEGIHLLGFNFVDSIKITIFLIFFVSFLAMFYLAKDYWGRLGGLISATAFIYVPYRAVDTFVRGSINELYGITFTILALLAVHNLIKHQSAKWTIAGAVFLAGIITSHNISALYAFPAIALFALGELVSIKSFTKKRIALLFSVFILGILLSAWYAVPAFLQKDFTAISSITSGYFHYSQHFLYLRQFLNSPWGFGGSIYGLEDGISFEIGKIQLILITISVSLLLWVKKTKPQTKIILITSYILMAASMLMATFKTQFLWDSITLLQYIQFPWRFLSLIIIFASLISGSAAMVIKRLKMPVLPTGIAIILVFILYYQPLFKPDSYLNSSADLYYEDEAKIQSHMSGILPDYLPKGVSYDKLSPPTSRIQLMTGDQIKDIGLTIDRTHEFLAEVPLSSSSKLLINIFQFPGWKFYLNNQEIDPETNTNLPIYTLDLDPQSLQTDQVYLSGVFTETPARMISNIISLLTALVLVGWWQIANNKVRNGSA